MADEEALLAANAAYYAAFQRADPTAMADVWARDAVTCIHPGWMILEGRDEVLKSYRLILLNPNQDPVTARRPVVYVDGDTARVLCVESVGGGMLAATNLFRREGTEWKMIHHHASPIVQRMTEAPPRSRLN